MEGRRDCRYRDRAKECRTGPVAASILPPSADPPEMLAVSADQPSARFPAKRGFVSGLLVRVLRSDDANAPPLKQSIRRQHAGTHIVPTQRGMIWAWDTRSHRTTFRWTSGSKVKRRRLRRTETTPRGAARIAAVQCSLSISLVALDRRKPVRLFVVTASPVSTSNLRTTPLSRHARSRRGIQ